ncbi:hypothetical protein [Dyella sp. GSA-30]|uniref:hypothetical protein n=1 Tax=Dyella sp. GSA-30 TaxID=2994496 RepID=UPI0024911D72|nr:hypothetical protein [Dyella sp. GSA-30]BDU22211.1 hypothetical protein DYGSA30_36680 [Dyella sp. GSA-30]
MGKVVASYGNSVTQTVVGVFPEGGFGALAGYAVKAANSAMGQGVLNYVLDAHLHLGKKLWGGFTFPGTVTVFDDRVEFKPSFLVKIPIYQGIESISFPYGEVEEVETVKKGPLKLSGVLIKAKAGPFLIMAPFDTKSITSSLKPYVKLK